MTLRTRPVVAALAAAVLAVALAPPAAAATGSVSSSGGNAFGQLGDGTTTSTTTPTTVLVNSPVAAASGRDTAYALDGSGRVWAWGNNSKGSVGDGTSTNRLRPVVLPLTGVVEVEAGHYHALALTSDQRVWAWGFGRLGQMGDGATVNRRSPVQVTDLADEDIVHVAAGRDASYALSGDGRVWAWGSGALGEMGNGSTASRLRPVEVPGLTGVVELAVGRNHVLALTGSGQVWAWGDDRYGQVGDGADGNAAQTVPVRLASLSDVRHVDAGAHHSLAVTTSGRVYSWGRGYRGQLGTGTTAARNAPGPVSGLPPDVVELGDGRDQSFAITASGDVWAWGQNAAGQLADGTTTVRRSPVRSRVTGASVAQGGSEHTIFLRQ